MINKTKEFNNIWFLDRMSHKTIEWYIYYTDWIFIPLQQNNFFKGTMPVKWIEAFVNNKEIIFRWPIWEFSSSLDLYNKWEFNSEIMTFSYFKKNIIWIIK
jgi:hypothetical protein